jgi:hypothetical protein
MDRSQSRFTNPSQLEMTTKQLYPEQSGECPGCVKGGI